MSYLKYISDKILKEIVENVIQIGMDSKENANESFYDNVIDPFAALIECSAFDVTPSDWKSSEMIRQSQKTLQNHIGELHQKILGSVRGWEDLGVGEQIDLVCNERKIIAEIKNKYNTVTGGKLSDQYHTLENLVSQKASKYKGYKAYFVTIIPSKRERFDIPFTPSDKSKGQKCPISEDIRIIDGSSFYKIATGRDEALKELFSALPKVIEDVLSKGSKKKTFKKNEIEVFLDYFNRAFN